MNVLMGSCDFLYVKWDVWQCCRTARKGAGDTGKYLTSNWKWDL